jgi:hypothetical protein
MGYNPTCTLKSRRILKVINMSRVLTDIDFNDLTQYRSGEETPNFRASVVSLYLSGVSGSAIARFLQRDKSVIKRILNQSGQNLRSNSEAQKTLNSARTLEERKAATLAANQAWRDREWTTEDSIRWASRRFALQSSVPSPRSENEREVFNFLTQEGVSFLTQCPVGSYNIDFVVGDIAIEIHGGSWHNTMRSRDALKAKAILDCGYRFVVIQCPGYAPLDARKLKNMIAYVQLTSLNEAPGSQYWVFMGDGKLIAQLSHDGDDLPFIPHSQKQFREWSDNQGTR